MLPKQPRIKMIVKKSLEQEARTFVFFIAIPAWRRHKWVWGGDGVIFLESLAGYRLNCQVVVAYDTMIQCDKTWYNQKQCDTIWYSVILYNVTRYDVIRYNMWYHMISYIVSYCNTLYHIVSYIIQYDVIRYTVIQNHVTRYDTMWFLMIPCDTIRYNLTRYDVIWNNTMLSNLH